MSQFQDVIVLWEFYFWKNKYKQKTKLSKSTHFVNIYFILYTNSSFAKIKIRKIYSTKFCYQL